MSRAPIEVHSFDEYADEFSNVVVGSTAAAADVVITFRGRNNRVEVADGARLGRLRVTFDCDNGTFTLAGSRGVPKFSALVRVGQDSSVVIGRNVSCTEVVGMSATEGTTITVGDDVMFASNNELRADDGHPIFDVRSGRRVNVSRSIRVGNHVWLGRGAVVLGGVRVGDGSVLGFGSVVTRSVPNNCVAAGVPARVVRRDIAWERPHLSLTQPYYKPDASTVKKSKYWRLTEDATVNRRTRALRSLRRRARAHPLGRFAVRVRNVLRRH